MHTHKTRIIAVALIAVVLIVSSIGAAYAYLTAADAKPVTNTFAPDTAVAPTISEDFTGTVKRDVCVDVGDPGYAVYVRAAIVVTWQTPKGEIHWKMPEVGATVDSGDYYLDWNDTDWFYYGGYYYLKEMVPSGETPNLINVCSQLQAAPDSGYGLKVEIVAQTIQALGTTDSGNVPAVTDAWGIPVSGGELQKP